MAKKPKTAPDPTIDPTRQVVCLDDHRNVITIVDVPEKPSFYLSLPDGTVWYHVDDDPDTGAWRYQRSK